MISKYPSEFDAGYDTNLKYDPNNFKNEPIQFRILGGAVRGLAAGIGLASEAAFSASDKLKSTRSGAPTPSSDEPDITV